MSGPILNRLPSLSGLQQIGASAESGVGSLLAAVSGTGHDQPGSPLGAVATVFQGISTSLNFDVSGLATQFPSALETMRNALPADSLDFVKSIGSAYDQAQSFLQDSPLAREVRPGSSLQEAALAVIAELLHAFQSRQSELAGKLIDPEALEAISSALDKLSGFRSDFAAHRAEFVPFLSRHLLGVAPDILRGPLDHLETINALLAPLESSAVETTLGETREVLTAAFRDLVDAVQTVDPADSASYTRINDRLTALETAIRRLCDAADPFYREAQTAVDAHAWETAFQTLREQLESISVTASLSVDEVVNDAATIVEGILTRLQAFVGPEDLIPRVEALNQSLHDLFASSALGQVRGSLRAFLEQIQHAIEAVPTEQIQQTVEQLLGRIKEEIDRLGLDRLAESIEQGFSDLETFITEHIDDALKDQVRGAVQSLIDDFKGLPIETVSSTLESAVEQVQSLLTELEAALQAGIDQLSEVAAQLEDLSFKPVSDAVIEEIDELKSRLREIKPNALSDVEKLAIKAAMAVLQAIDLESIITDQVKRGFGAAKDEVKSLLDQLAAILDLLRERLDAFEPRDLIGGLTGLLDQAGQAVDALNARTLLRPLYDQINQFAERLREISPGSLLDPLRQPYQTVRGAINQLNPDQLIAPLNELYAQIDTLIGYVDVTPLFDELDRRRRELFNSARTALLAAFDSLSLPEPLGSFFTALRPVLEAITDAIFQDPDTEISRISLDLRSRFHLSSLFAPLDDAFDELLEMAASVPEQELVAALENLRLQVGVGLDALDPRRVVEMLRMGERRFAALSPDLLFALPNGLPSVKLALELRIEAAPPSQQANAAATLARFDAVFQLTSPVDPRSLLTPLISAHSRVEAALRSRIDALDPSAADSAYIRVREMVDQFLPDFLRQTSELTHDEILAGLESLRPSRKAEALDRVFDRFLNKVQTIQTALEPAMNDFFRQLREMVQLLNPLALKDAVADIYAAIRQKVRVLDPARLAASLHESIYDPLISAIEAIDPAALKARLDRVFQSALRAIENNLKDILDDIAGALDELFQSLREEVKKMIDAVKAALDRAVQIFDSLVERVEHLVLVEILERLRHVIDALGVSFDRELDRVRSAFDEMLAAIPLSGGASVST